VKSRELEIPISVQYSTDGVKVDDLASDVGLGWQLNAGGVIGRVMRGLPDEFDGPYTIMPDGHHPANVAAKGFLDASVGDYADKDYFISDSRSVNDRKRIVEYSNKTGDYVSLGGDPKVWDTEPDEFYFNFDRYSGKFVFDKNGDIQIVPHQNLLITKIITNNLYPSNEAGVSMITSFQITDDRGIKYTFGNVNPTSKTQMTAIEVTKYSLYSVFFQLAYYSLGSYWYMGTTPPTYLRLFATTPVLLLDNGVAAFGLDTVENKQTFTSSWYLTKVESPNGDFINLEYENADIKYLTGRTIDVTQLNLDVYNDGVTNIFATDYYNDVLPSISATGLYQGQRFTITTSKSTINSKKLLSITAATGEKVFFQSTTARPDLVGAKRLESIKIINSSNEWIKTYNFNYELSISDPELYFYEFKVLDERTGKFRYPHEFMRDSVTNNNYYLNYIYSAVPFEGDWLAMMIADHYRMFLSGITETFFGGTTRDLVSFEYNTNYILPVRLSAKQDYYGYYNNNFAGHTLRNMNYRDSWGDPVPLPVVFASLYIVDQELYMRPTETNHSSVTEKAKAGVLKNIFYRNGSKISIEYEHNQGLRVSKISYFPDKNISSSEDINYVYNDPQPASFGAKFSNAFPVMTIGGGRRRASIYSSSVPVNQSLNKTKGGFVGYGLVEKVRTGLGKEIFEFSHPGSNPDTDYLRYGVENSENSVNGTAIQLNTCDCFPYAPKNNVDYQRGLLKKVTVKNQAGQTLKSDTYNYNINPSGYIPKIIYGLKPGRYVFDGIPIFIAAFYHYKTDWVYLDNVESKLYDQADPGNEAKSAITTTHYHYYRPGESTPVSDLLARKVSITLPTGEKLITETKFPGDYIFTGLPTGSDAVGISLLKSKKIESVPIESMSYLEKSNGSETVKYLLGASLSKFKQFYTGKVFLWEHYKLKAGIGSSFTTYPWSTINESNSFSWTNGTNFKLVKSINSYDTFGNPLTETGEDGIQQTYTWGYNSSLLTSLTHNAGTYQHQTAYVYKPLVGVTQVTDPNSRNSKYTYDKFNRLRLEKDHDDQITARYRYHYKDETDGFTNASIYTSGCPISGQSVTFSSYENVEYGETVYDWNFGDGSTASGTTAVSHTFSSQGTYNVTVTKRNPEYADFTTQKTLTIYRPVTAVNGSTTGPTSYDICTLTPPSQSTTLTAFFKNGIHAAGDAFSVIWEYRFNGGQWITITQLQGPVSSTSVGAPVGFGDPTIVGTWEVRCTGEDACGTSYSTSFTLTNYASNPICSGH
jgi:YD repeat-containing protein